MRFETVPFWSLALLESEKATDGGLPVALEAVESGTGRLLDGVEVEPGEGKRFLPGDTLFGKLRPYLAKSWLADQEGVALGDIHVYRPREGVDPRFVSYVVQSDIFVSLATASSTGAKMPRVEWSKVAQFPVPSPPLEEQKAIADYLDREIGELDEMDAELNQMESILLDRRGSIIQATVLPDEGDYTRLKFMANVSLGKTVQNTQKSPDERLYNYVRAAHIQPAGRLVLDDQMMYFLPSELKKYDLREGDVLVVEGGAGYGRSVYLHTDLEQWGFQNHVIRVRPFDRVSGEFLHRTVEAHYRAGLIDAVAAGATIPAISSDKVRELPVLNVSEAEQAEMVERIRASVSDMDFMLAEIGTLRALLRERRVALIQNAINGTIEVNTYCLLYTSPSPRDS